MVFTKPNPPKMLVFYQIDRAIPMKTYGIKIALRGVSPMIWRRLRVPGNTSLAQLHRAIQIAYHWDDDYLHQFHIYGKDYGTHNSAGFAHAYGADAVTLDDFQFDIGDKFFYEYNFFEHYRIDIRIENIENAKQASVFCTKGNGMIGADKYDELELTMNLFKAIANTDEHTTVGDIRSFVEALNAVRFNRHHVNHRIKSVLSSGL